MSSTRAVRDHTPVEGLRSTKSNEPQKPVPLSAHRPVAARGPLFAALIVARVPESATDSATSADASSSSITANALGLISVAPLTFFKLTKSVSLFSGTVSPRTATSMFFAVSPGAKLRVPVAAV